MSNAFHNDDINAYRACFAGRGRGVIWYATRDIAPKDRKRTIVRVLGNHLNRPSVGERCG